MAYNVLIVEDQNMPRELFEIYVKSGKNFNHVLSIANASTAIAVCRAKKIDLVLMDVMTELGQSGLDASAEIKKEFPNIKIIIVTSMPEYSWIARARQIGVDSFWYKDCQKESILNVMERTMAGRTFTRTKPRSKEPRNSYKKAQFVKDKVQKSRNIWRAKSRRF